MGIHRGGDIMNIPTIHETGVQLTENISKVIIGKDRTILLTLIAMLCKGHILLDDVPGVGRRC